MRSPRSEITSWLSQKLPNYTSEAAITSVDIIVDILGVSLQELKPTDRLTADLKADELEPVEIVSAIEQELGVSISDEEAGKILTVHDLVAFVCDDTTRA